LTTLHLNYEEIEEQFNVTAVIVIEGCLWLFVVALLSAVITIVLSITSPSCIIGGLLLALVLHLLCVGNTGHNSSVVCCLSCQPLGFGQKDVG